MLPTSPQLLPSSPPQRSPTATPLPTAPSQPPSPSAPSSRPPDGSPLPSSYPDVHRSSSGQQVLDAPKHTDANLAGCAYRVPSTTSAALSALALTRAQSTDSVALNRPALQRAGHSPGCYKACRSKAGRSNAGRFYAGATRSSRAADSDECGRHARALLSARRRSRAAQPASSGASTNL